MAAAGGRTIVSSRQTVGGGVGFLPERTRCPCSCAVVAVRSGNWIQIRELKQRPSSARVLSSVIRTGVIVSQLEDEGSSKSHSKVFKSMQDAADRRKESDASAAALASFDAVDIARAISDAEVAASSTSRGAKAVQPPRFATLRAFGETGGEGVMTGEFEGTSVFELIAANIEASKQVKNWEVLSGRLAMLAISVALGVELCTGNSVFKGIDVEKLEAVAALCAVATVSAAGFAYAWRAKSDVVGLMSKSYKNMVESALDNLIDGLFFDEA